MKPFNPIAVAAFFVALIPSPYFAQTPPAATPPAATPPAATPPAATPPAATPPSVTPPSATPPAASAPSATAPAIQARQVQVRPANELSGKISEVTLYQGTALVSRQVSIPESMQGAVELIVGPLPKTTQPETVYADLMKGVVVRSVTCRSHPPDGEAQLLTRAQEVAAEIKLLKTKMAIGRNEIALRRIRQEYLKDLQKFVAPAATQEMTHGVLQSKEIEAVTQMHFREYETASQEIMELDLELIDAQETLTKLDGESAKLAAGPDITYDAIIYLEKAAVGPAELSLNYLVDDCGWRPVYNVRGDTTKKGVEFEFNALIHQVSGEDWSNVQVSLSTASPKTSAYNPMLAPLHVSMASGAGENASGGNADAYRNAMATKQTAMESQFRAKSMNDVASANFRANDIASSVQLIELSENFGELRALTDTAGEELSIRYEISVPVSLVSRRDAQMVPVLRHLAPAEFYHVAVPVLTTSVFHEAEILNDSNHDLLGGAVNVYLNGEFKGRTDVPTIAHGCSFTLGFGVDGQIKARRSLADRRDDVQGGNRMISLTPEIHIENFKTEAVTIRLRERMPFMDDSTKLRVATTELSHPLSDDADYKRYEKVKGILRWDLSVPPGVGVKGTTLRYAYSLEFDKNLTLHDISQDLKTRVQKEFIDRSINSNKLRR